MKNPIVHFEIPANDTARAIKFYQDTFGWQINKFDMPTGEYFGVTTTEVDEKHQPTSPGINGGLMKRNNLDQPFMNYIQVSDIDEMLSAIENNGGVVAMPKTEIAPNMGWIAAFKDTEGNLLGLHQFVNNQA